ncbi:HK97 family phage prohead protease [Nocardioides nanhaiensis]|uniref:Prohead serine protease domain-containing protein n=1 Tax=Nocardioides nanhaiensis TaxID=1476871 RepID=A0ABP8WZR5_9ACTN
MTKYETEMKFDAPQQGASFSVDTTKREIKGLALPYGKTAKANGLTWQFAKGVLKFEDVSRVKLLAGHDWTQAIGKAVELEDTDEGLLATFKVARGAAGDNALALAEDGVWDGLSIGTNEITEYEERDGVYHALSAPLAEISLTPCPAFSDARVTSVAASRDNTKENPNMTDTEVTHEAAQPVTMDVLTEALRNAFTGPEVVNPTPKFEVNEPLPYRFDGIKAEHSLSLDMRAAQQGDSVARQRVDEFLKAAFAVTTGNATSLNPTQNRPELYVPNLSFTRPLFELVTTGSVDSVTPFTIPKFNSASGLVGPHTQGVEPTPGAFSATNQTVTPSALSGKIEINREVLDQGGSPQADQIIWNEMLNGWYEAIEARIATQLQASATAELNLASAVDSALVGSLTNYFAGLQFVRGGNRFTAFAADGSLFPALIAAKDSSGRPLLPILGPTNATGQVSSGFDRVQVGNQDIRAAWALGTGNAARSFSFVPSSVYCWVSAPDRFDFQYQVKSIDMAIWGYCATAVTRDSDVKPVDYTTADA